jgi:hypothetical protein
MRSETQTSAASGCELIEQAIQQLRENQNRADTLRPLSAF